jgi:hypothetical protein
LTEYSAFQLIECSMFLFIDYSERPYYCD